MSTTSNRSARSSRKSSTRLWIAQVVLAALFLFAGGMKLVTPLDALAAMAHMNGAFLKFIGACETLGALGLVLPGLFRTQRHLTPLAALGLVIIMIGAVTTTAARGEIAGAITPLLVGLIAAYVARGRWPVAIRPNTVRPTVLRRSVGRAA
jgi:uncharacterized membrane protein HdeD (DUF308 family)